MKKVLLISAFVAAFIVSGCSEQTTVEVDDGATSASSTDGSGSTSRSGDSGSTVGQGGSSMDSGSMGSGSSDGLMSVYFRFDQFVIEGNANIQAVKNNATYITNNNAYEVRVEGNTDEWGSDEYNYALALKRASSVKDALVNEGIAVDKIKLVSYGESKPRCMEQTKKCWQENRRVDFVLIPQQ